MNAESVPMILLWSSWLFLPTWIPIVVSAAVAAFRDSP